MEEVRAKTAEEVRKLFLDTARQIAKYWATLDDNRSTQERCDGVVFSMLNIFDGTTIELPAMDIALRPHPSDEQYNKDTENNWYDDGMIINNVMLHEEYYKK